MPISVGPPPDADIHEVLTANFLFSPLHTAVPGAVNHSEENVTELREVKAQVASGGNSTNPAQYCHTCQCFVMGGKGVGKGHEGHKTTKLTKESLTRPTSLLSALDVNKTHAQFLFACSSVDYIVGELKRLGLINVLCIGTPRCVCVYVCMCRGCAVRMCTAFSVNRLLCEGL